MTSHPEPGISQAPDVPLMGYPGGWSIRPGSPVHFMVSASVPRYQAEIVRITGRGPRPDGDGPPLSYERVPSEVDGSYAGTEHQTVSGSCAVTGQARPSPAGEGSVSAWIYPTLPAAGRWQAIVTWLGADGQPGLELGISGTGQLALRCRRADGSSAELRSARPLAARQWHYVAGSAGPAAGQVVLLHQAGGRGPARPADVMTSREELLAAPLGGDARVAARSAAPADPAALTSVADGAYNGKIDAAAARPAALDAAGLLAQAQDAASVLAGLRFANAPSRLATGHNWSGRALDWRVSPAEYQATWYHDDDLADAGWPPAFSWQVPADARSGMYAARLTAGDYEEVIPFCVRPAAGARPAPLAVLIPTFTYTIYSNFHHPARSATASAGGTQDEITSAFLGEHRELGLSVYCKHRDGSGIAQVSSRRPMIDQRPWHRIATRGNAGREVSGDLYLLDWLEHEGIEYDTITDHDLHADGADLLRPYAGIVTGGHPEYVSETMLDALGAYVDAGGHLAYLGGNGFYWVTAVADGAPHLLEVRRGRRGSRTWTGEPGEDHHSSGEPGGVWVDRGRAPQALTGVGFCAQGGGPGAGYDRMPDSHDPRAAFIFDGIGPDEVIGAFGLKLGGAAADELDRADFALGTPPETLVVASTRGKHDDAYQRAVEEVEEMNPRQGGSQSQDVRADMTYRQTPGGGSVFSVGSIAWSASLSHNGYDNNVARVTGNVLRQFTRGGTRSGS